jgi:hypothetical protein
LEKVILVQEENLMQKHAWKVSKSRGRPNVLSMSAWTIANDILSPILS